jgi:hypothetical protein
MRGVAPVAAHSMLAVAALAGCAAAPPPPHAHREGAVVSRSWEDLRGEAARAEAARLLATLPEQIVEIAENRSGPGYPLTHFTLFETPESSRHAGLCQVKAHDVGVNFLPPPAEGLRRAEWVRTSTRYFAIGEVTSSIRPDNQQTACASLPSARNFFTASSPEGAFPALQAYTEARRWAREGSRALTISCEALGDQCRDPRAILDSLLEPSHIRSVEQLPCPPELPGRALDCHRIHFRDPGGEPPHGDWAVTIRGPERPLHVHIMQMMRPVV